jgi:N-acetyl-anhydromuramyl-L-alanine amidase AmpD
MMFFKKPIILPNKIEWKQKSNNEIAPIGVTVHCMSYLIKGEDSKKFINDLSCSAHAFSYSDGSVQLGIAPDFRANHAGESEWENIRNLNNHFLGIEAMIPVEFKSYTEFIDFICTNTEWVTDEQYQATVWVVAKWCQDYDIEVDMVTYHSMISPGRKLDPGVGFPHIKDFRNDVFKLVSYGFF